MRQTRDARGRHRPRFRHARFSHALQVVLAGSADANDQRSFNKWIIRTAEIRAVRSLVRRPTGARVREALALVPDSFDPRVDLRWSGFRVSVSRVEHRL